MATTKKNTAPKKTAVKKTVTKKVSTKKEEKSASTKELNYTSLRAILVVLCAAAAIAFCLPFGDLLYCENLSGVGIISEIFDSMWDAEIGVYPAFYEIIIPAILVIVSTLMLLVKCDKLTSFISIMFSGVSVILYLAGFSIIEGHMVGWQLSFACAIIVLIFSIILFVTFPSKKKR